MIGLRPSFALLLALFASGCVTNAPPSDALVSVAPAPMPAPVREEAFGDPAYMYRQIEDGGFTVAAVDVSRLKPQYVRQIVDFSGDEAPGTIIVDQGTRFLYLVQPGGRAIRYAVGVGPVARAYGGGEAVIARKGTWPRWRPTDNMIARSPEQYKKFEKGVDGGPGNPLGARALYMYRDGVDTYYRVHGTNKPSSIGQAVSAGCIRMLNQDVIDLHSRVRTGARIIVR
ncbi:MAG: L,D-transpeptidase [Mesorhizobium sp.]